MRNRFASTSRHCPSVDDPAKSSYTKRPKFLSGGGGLVSTAADYMRFCLMLSGKGTLAGKRLLKAETVERAVKPVVYEAIVDDLNSRKGEQE